MPIDIPDLWGDDIQVDVLPPLVILKAQDEAIRRKTQGILRTEVISTEEQGGGDSGWVIHTLDVIALAMGYRESLLTVSHGSERLYPATVEMPEHIAWSDGTVSIQIRCFTAAEFLRELGVALRSGPTK